MKKPKEYSSSIYVRVFLKNSAYFYFVMESYEGLAICVTLDFKPGDPTRDIEVKFSPDSEEDVREILKALHKEIPFEFITKEQV